MNPNDPHADPHGNPLPDSVRWQLCELRREHVPTRDLWPGIAARLATAQRPENGAEPTSLHRGGRRLRSARRSPLPAALAATLVLALGFLGWQQGLLGDPSAVPATAPGAAPSLVQREAAGMTLQYQAALVEVGGAPADATPALQPAFDELDRSVRLILDALEHDPDSRLLLQQLRRTYSHRLALAQRIVIS